MRRPLKLAAVALGVIAVERVLAWAAPRSTVHGLATAVLVITVAVVAFITLRWLWRKLTYRVGARLFWSYLLIGLVPFPLLALLGATAVYMFVGQYASVRFGETFDHCGEALSLVAGEAADRLEQRGATAAAELLAIRAQAPPAPLPRLEWLVADGDKVLHSDGAAGLGPPAWVGQGRWSGALKSGPVTYRAELERRGQRLIACLLPLDPTTAKRLSEGRWFEVNLTAGTVDSGEGHGSEGSLSITTDDEGKAEAGGPAAETRSMSPPSGGEASGNSLGSARATSPAKPGGLLERRWVVWFRIGEPLHAWQDGALILKHRVVALLRTSIAAAWRDFADSPYEAGTKFLMALRVLGTFCGLLYAIAVALAAVQILTITRSTARLTRGAREVARGNLDYRIPVKRHDQLGDLAVSFNRMSESVKEMLSHVAEKERLARELELAREIQEGLLPPASAQHGEISVDAHFRPAAEVGGDYFDVLPVENGRLVVAVGDVAGHGVSTGLLMATVKSAVATLVHEGRSGVDLMQRLNTVILENPRRHRTATLLLCEVGSTTAAGEVRLTSAGHPPAFVISPEGEVGEMLFSALPLGHPWPDLPVTTALPFPAGSRLFIYTDGLVEAENAAGKALGYDGLYRVLQRHASLGAGDLLRAVLADLDRHADVGPLADDLTLVVVERRTPEAPPAA